MVHRPLGFDILDKEKDSEKAEIFRKIEPYLTFLNIPQLERQGANTQSKIEELEQLNQAMMTHLSAYQLIAFTARLKA